MGQGDKAIGICIPHSFDALIGGNTSLHDEITRYAKQFFLTPQPALSMFRTLPNGEVLYLPGTGNRAILQKPQIRNFITIQAATHTALDLELQNLSQSIGFDGTYRADGMQWAHSCEAVLTSVIPQVPFNEREIIIMNIEMVFQPLDDFVSGLIS